MEIEYKWVLADSAQAAQLAAYCEQWAARDPQTISLLATYYDTPEQLLKEMHGAVRLRAENGVGVCCLKLPCQSEGEGYKAREEYEVAAESLEEGLRLLPGVGAPAELVERLLASELAPTAQTDFVRTAYDLCIDNERGRCTAVLAVDDGFLRNGPREAALLELELEYADGEQPAFHAFAHELAERFSLRVQPLSKLARAAQL